MVVVAVAVGGRTVPATGCFRRLMTEQQLIERVITCCRLLLLQDRSLDKCQRIRQCASLGGWGGSDGGSVGGAGALR